MQRVRRWTIRPSANGSRGCARPTSRIIRPWRRRSGRSSTPRPAGVRRDASRRSRGVRAEPARRGLRAVPCRSRTARVVVGAWPDAERDGSLPGDPLEDDRALPPVRPVGGDAAARRGGRRDRRRRRRPHARSPDRRERRRLRCLARAILVRARRRRRRPTGRVLVAGQDWGAPPPHPHGAREAGYRYHDEVFRTLFRYAAIARIDHVIGLHRLYWVPRGARARDGVYVRYRAQEWYALLSSRRTVTGGGGRRGSRNGPGTVRPAMRAHGILRTYVAQPEAGSGGLPEPPAESVAALNTHDMPTWALLAGSRRAAPAGARTDRPLAGR